MLLRVIRVTDVARLVGGSAVSATAFVVADWLLVGALESLGHRRDGVPEP